MKLKGAVIVVIILLVAIRIIAATAIPTFHGDELNRAETVGDILDGGDFQRETFSLGPVPIFVHTDAGFSSLPFFAPATIWAFFFGTSPTSLRIFITLIVTLSLVLLAHTISLWFEKSRRQKIFLLGSIIALTFPWLFLQGLNFWDTAFAPTCFILAFYAFTKIATTKSPPKLFHRLLLPLALITSVYIYLPSAIPAVILYTCAHVYLARTQKLHLKPLLVSIGVSILVCLPFIIFFLTFPGGSTRTTELSVFHNTPLIDGLIRLVQNFIWMFNPCFLFITGDGSLLHSIGLLGMLGTLSIAPIVWSFYYRIKNLFTKNEKLLFTIALIGIAAGNLSSALTNGGNPHSLRANAATPFYILLIVLGAQKFIHRHPKSTIPIYILLALFALTYLFIFFFIYQPIALDWFTHR